MTAVKAPKGVATALGRLPLGQSRSAATDLYLDIAIVVVSVGLAVLSLREYIAPDYRVEIVPALNGLQQNGIQGFLDHLPGYPAAVVVQLIPAKIALLLGASEPTVWRILSALGISTIALAVLAAIPLIRATEVSRGAARVAVALAVGSPTAYWALRIGHPEELMATGMLLGAVIAAARERPIIAGVLLGLAAGKAWPAVAAFPVLGLLLPSWRRLSVGTIAAAAAAAAIYLPSLLFASAPVQSLANLGTSAIFNVGQLFWWFGSPIPAANVALQTVPQPRLGPVWSGELSHPLILGVGWAIGMVWCWSLLQRLSRSRSIAALRSDGRTRSKEESAQLAAAALLVMAGILYARCFLDTWNVPYYLMGGLVLGAIGEVLSGRRPLITLVATGMMWKWAAPGDLTVRSDPDVYTALYLAWMIPACIAFLTMGFAAARRGIGMRAPDAAAAPEPSTQTVVTELPRT